MIFGIGVDVVHIERFEKYTSKSPFMEKHFTPEELAVLGESSKNFPQRAAGFYGAKEAYVKALGQGFRTLSPKDISVSLGSLGEPSITLSQKAVAHSRELGAGSALLSISHDSGVAVAFVVIQRLS